MHIMGSGSGQRQLSKMSFQMMAWEWNSRILLPFPFSYNLTIGLLISLVCSLSLLSCVNCFEYECDPGSRECFCSAGLDGSDWEIQCPADLLEIHPITLKGKMRDFLYIDSCQHDELFLFILLVK